MHRETEQSGGSAREQPSQEGLTEMRRAGSYSIIFCIKSTPSASSVGKNRDKSWACHWGHSCLQVNGGFSSTVSPLRSPPLTPDFQATIPGQCNAPVPEPCDARPVLLSGRSKQLEDVQQLLQLAVSGEESLLRMEGEEAEGTNIDAMQGERHIGAS